MLGYHRLTEIDRQYFEEFFQAAQILAISQPVLEQAVRLRQMRRLSLGDGIIAATGLVHNLTVVTRNIDDFRWIEGLRLYNPFEGDGRLNF